MSEQDVSWQITAGRCGACVKFVKDFGAGEDAAYGHCGVKPRSGSIASTNFKCDVYRPRPGVEDEAAAASDAAPRKQRFDPFDPQLSAATLVERSAERASPTRRRRRRAATVHVRRPSRQERDREPVEFGEEEMDRGTLRDLIREAIDDSMGLGEVELVDRFVGGNVVIEPGDENTQAKTIPIDNLIRKIIMIRENLRVLEQKVNSNPKLDDADRIQLQQYITRCYGSLTTFNMLFKHPEDRFSGAGG